MAPSANEFDARALGDLHHTSYRMCFGNDLTHGEMHWLTRRLFAQSSSERQTAHLRPTVGFPCVFGLGRQAILEEGIWRGLRYEGVCGVLLVVVVERFFCIEV